MKNISKNLLNDWEGLLGENIDLNLFDSEISLLEQKELFSKYVKIINLETFSYCNRKCSYCPVSFLSSKNNSHLDKKVFISIIEDLKSINYSNKISLNLYNEPLSDESIFDTIQYIHQKLPKAFIFFNSNGDYVTLDKLELLSKIGLNALNITLHTQPNKTYDDNDSDTAIKNFYTKIGKDYKIDSIKENEYIKTSFKVGNLLISVTTTNYDSYGESRAGLIEHLNSDIIRNFPCARPFREFTISSNGHVYPCCQIYPELDNFENSMGDLVKNNIFEIYTSSRLSNLREHLFDYSPKKSPCNKCTDVFLHKYRKKLV